MLIVSNKKEFFNKYVRIKQNYKIWKYVLPGAINFGRQCHFKIWLDCHKFKIFPCLIMSTNCQKNEKK
jgi:hypothetical protein